MRDQKSHLNNVAIVVGPNVYSIFQQDIMLYNHCLTLDDDIYPSVT